MLLILSLLLTACAPLGVKINIIKIGLVAPFEGRYRYIGYDAIYAARMAVREINAKGGIDGWRIDLVAYDDRASPDMARNAARNLVVDQDVVAVIGHYRAESTAAAQSIYAAAHIPLIVIGTWLTASLNTPQLKTSWHLMPPPRQMAQAMVNTANTRANQESLAVVADTSQLGESPLALALCQESDTMLERGYVEQSAGDIPLPHADAVLSVLPPHIGAENLTTWRSMGWQGHYIGGLDCAAGEFTAIAGEAIEGVQFVTPYPVPQALLMSNAQTERGQDIETWITRYQAIGPHVAPPGIYALPTYEAVYLLSEALARTIETKRLSDKRTGIAIALSTIQRQGLLGTIAWDTDSFWSQAPLYIYRWTEGHPVPVKHSSPTQKSDF